MHRRGKQSKRDAIETRTDRRKATAAATTKGKPLILQVNSRNVAGVAAVAVVIVVVVGVVVVGVVDVTGPRQKANKRENDLLFSIKCYSCWLVGPSPDTNNVNSRSWSALLDRPVMMTSQTASRRAANDFLLSLPSRGASGLPRRAGMDAPTNSIEVRRSNGARK